MARTVSALALVGLVSGALAGGPAVEGDTVAPAPYPGAADCSCDGRRAPRRQPDASPPRAEWAHKHWVWVPHAESDQSNVLANLEAYRRHNIAVGALNVDSGALRSAPPAPSGPLL